MYRLDLPLPDSSLLEDHLFSKIILCVVLTTVIIVEKR